MTAVAPVLPGETLGGKYRVERVLGQGGMGVVVAARHLDLDERVAIKFLVGKPSDSAADRFIREARAAAKVKGEHVCRVFDFGRLETGEPYIVMEHLEGIDLARKLDGDGPQAPSAVVGWMIEACDALAAAHALGIVHRDLKPANVFLANRPDGSTCAKVLDFGISKLPSQGTMTGPQTTMGSPAYMSPEQMESSRDVDARSDVWSIGVMMYELMSGRPPFVAESAIQLAVMIREVEAAPLRGVPEGLGRIITKCLAKMPDDRYASVAELVADLAPFAPAEVATLASRISRRMRATADASIALDVTAEDVERRHTPSGSPRATPAAQARAQVTFEPLQSTVASSPPAPPTRRWPLGFGALAVIVVVGFAMQRMAARTSGGEVSAEAAAPTASVTAPAAVSSATEAATVTPPPSATTPTVHASATATATATPTTPKTATEPTVKPAGVASAKPAQTPTAATVASAPLAFPSAPPVSPTASGTAPKAAGDGKKKRELDRDDPL